MTVTLLHGDCREMLETLPAESVQCCVTSPPYFGLRDYGVDGQIGLEQSPQEYVDQMVAVFREVRRVLRMDGTLWLNLGDSYAANRTYQVSQTKHLSHDFGASNAQRVPDGLKPKDLLLIPARVALALQADGWWVRSEIIWSKAAPMPESVRDRPTCAHEKVWLLAKSERYFYDANAVAEPSCVQAGRPQRRRAVELAHEGGLTDEHIAALRSCGVGDAGKAQRTQSGFGRNRDEIQALSDHAKKVLGGYTREFLISKTKNLRNVWHLNPEPFPGAHFATMPPTLAERCIKAGSRPGDTVLDPFAGAGTTLLAADRLQRHALGIELNPEYIEIARRRIAGDAPLFSEVA